MNVREFSQANGEWNDHGKALSQGKRVTEHQKILSGEKCWMWDVWESLRWERGSPLTTHWRACPGENPYTCKECGKAFVALSQLTLHRNGQFILRKGPINVESVEKPLELTQMSLGTWECILEYTHCEKTFRNSSSLTSKTTPERSSAHKENSEVLNQCPRRSLWAVLNNYKEIIGRNWLDSLH